MPEASPCRACGALPCDQTSPAPDPTNALVVAVAALKDIAVFGRRMPGHGYSCGTKALAALDRIGPLTDD